LRARVPLPHALAFNGSISYARTRNRFTDYPQNLLNADATLNWNPRRILRTTVDFHQQNLLNDFTPDFPLFGNLSLHRYWVGARVDSTATSFLDLEAHYRRTNVTRSNAFLWPQEYSPGTIGLVGTIADAFVTRVIPATFSNTAGVSAKLHHGERCSLRTGYEWVGTHAPGYLTDPQTAHRAFATGSLAVTDWLTFTDDFSVLLQNSFVGIQRRNRLWLNTAYLTVKPLWQRADWTLSLGYGYYQNNLQTDLMYGVDPFYPESFVPFKALSQSYSVSSAYLLKKKLAWNLDFSTVSSRSDFRPNLTSPLIPLCGTVPCSDSVVVAQAISLINVPQIGVGSTLDYRWGWGMNSGIRFQYAGYSDRVPRDSSGQLVRPNLTGHFRSFTLFVGRTW
ncbi:MAG: hypothetical protein HY237_13155, partial [Acidobacteria bacterium]|nr:hypothetical protein [Acidobacteriota bacterium]